MARSGASTLSWMPPMGAHPCLRKIAAFGVQPDQTNSVGHFAFMLGVAVARIAYRPAHTSCNTPPNVSNAIAKGYTK